MTTESKPKRSVFKKILYILACLVVILLIAGIIMPKDIHTSISKNIDVPSNYAFNLVNNQMSMPTWNAWVIEDKETKVSYDNIIVGKGSGYSWKSKKFGDGSIKYIDVMPGKKIEASLMMDGTESKSTLKFYNENGQSTIVWDFDSHMAYPKNVFAPFLTYMINKKNRQSVDYMVEEIKKRQKGVYFGYQVNESSQNQKYFVTSRSTVTFDQIAQFYTQTLAAMYQKLQTEGITASGAPCALFYTYDEVGLKTDMAVAVPVLTPVAVKELGSETFPIQNAATIDYYGDSAKNKMAHYALNNYVKDRNLVETNAVLEEYLSDPIKEKDPSKWLTKIYYYTTEKK
jgi:effector-binding domain-containing protein